MNLNFERSYQFQTKDKNWIKKFVVITAVYALQVIILSFFLVLAMVLGLTSVIKDNSGLIIILMFVISLIGFMINIPLQFYWSGYLNDIVLNVIKGDKSSLPEIKPFGKRFKTGLEMVLFTLPQSIIANIFLIPFMVSYISLFLNGFMDVPIAIIVMIVSWVLSLGLGIITNILITPAQYYIYLKEGFRESFNYGKILRLSKKHLKKFIVVFLISWVSSIVFGMVAYIPVLGLVAISYILTMIRHLHGQVYSELDKEIARKK